MAHWNHRVIRKKIQNGSEQEDWYGIHEVYYDDDEEIEGVTEKAIAPGGSTLEELKNELQRMIKCLDKGILEDQDF